MDQETGKPIEEYPFSNRCWFFHDYGKWERVKKTFFSTNILGEKVPNSEYVEWYQRRICKKCGFIQERKI